MSSALFQTDVMFSNIYISLCPHCRCQGSKSAETSLNPAERILTDSTARRVHFNTDQMLVVLFCAWFQPRF